MKLQDMMYISLFAAIVGVLGFIPPIPLPFSPVPITAQTLGVMLAGGILGARRGGLSLLLFIALVAIGTPLLTGGREIGRASCRERGRGQQVEGTERQEHE